MTRPFDLAHEYRKRGWSGTLPLPVGKKTPPPDGYTGAEGAWPTEEQVYKWAHNGASNIAIRLPEIVAGIDVDDYEEKHGAESLAALEEKWGPLPPTWISTSRDGVSGIRLFRIPPGVEAALGDPGPDIEVIRFGWRYMVAAPSLHPDGRRYRLIRPDGSDADPGEIPSPDELPMLPPAWLSGMLGTGSAGASSPRASRRERDRQAQEWLDTLPGGEPCTYVGKLAAELYAIAAREEAQVHDNSLGAILALLRAAEMGHPGVPDVLDRAAVIYVKTVGAIRGGGTVADAEFDRMVTGGVVKIINAPGEKAGRGCDCGTRVSFEPVPAHLTRQSRAARHFANRAGDRVRYDHGQRRWLLWSGHRWRPDMDGSVERLWLSVIADRYRDALAIADNDKRTKALDAIQSAGATAGAIAAGLDIASNMKPIATAPDAWDLDPYLLCCENGVVDLRTGDLRNGRPEDMISRSTGIDYDAEATASRWALFLKEVFPSDDQLVSWVNRLVGASLIGEMTELLPIHHGLGNNGKSVFSQALRDALGDYCVPISIETLVSAKRSAGQATPDLMPLRGARLAFTSEPDQAAKLKGGTLKRLSSIDKMTGRPNYGDQQTWRPTHTLHLLTNHLPGVEDATDGFWRRIALIPWLVHFLKDGETGQGPAEDSHLAAKLDAELPGILAWAVRGAIAYGARSSLWPLPEAVRVRTAAYRADEDQLASFVEEMIVYEKEGTVSGVDLFGAYIGWCEREQVPKYEKLGRTTLLREFEERGKVKRTKDGHGSAHFSGARLRTASEKSEFSGTNPTTSTREATRESKGNGTKTSETSDDRAGQDWCLDPIQHQPLHFTTWDGERRCRVCTPLPEAKPA